MPDGDILTLERSFGAHVASRHGDPPLSPIAVIEAAPRSSPKLLFAGRTPFYAIDNMEGIAVCERDGETRVTLMSDNNFNTNLQSTLLLQFA